MRDGERRLERGAGNPAVHRYNEAEGVLWERAPTQRWRRWEGGWFYPALTSLAEAPRSWKITQADTVLATCCLRGHPSVLD